MKIKIAVIDQDKVYLNRIMTALNSRYADKVEIYLFSSMDILTEQVKQLKLDVLLVSEDFEVDTKLIPGNCSFAYIVSNAEIDSLRGEQTIAKFQRVDQFYKQILFLYSEKESNAVIRMDNGEYTKVVGFFSPAGGVGSSTLAASFACAVVNSGKRALYLNLEQLPSTDLFFQGEGKSDFSDVIYALKSKRTSLPLKLESTVRNDSRGVAFYKSEPIALDRLELTDEDIQTLIDELVKTGSYDFVVVDGDYSFSDRFFKLYALCNTAVFVSDGTEMANNKLEKAYHALSMMEEQQDIHILDKAVVCYNRFSNKSGKILEGIEIPTIGGAPRYANSDEIVNELSKLNMFATLMA